MYVTIRREPRNTTKHVQQTKYGRFPGESRQYLQYGAELRRQVAEPLPLLVDRLADPAFVRVQLLTVRGQPAALLQLPVQPGQVAPVTVPLSHRLGREDTSQPQSSRARWRRWLSP